MIDSESCRSLFRVFFTAIRNNEYCPPLARASAAGDLGMLELRGGDVLDGDGPRDIGLRKLR